MADEAAGRKVIGKFKKFVSILAFLYILYHVFYLSDAYLYLGLRGLTSYFHMGIHYGIILFFVFLLFPLRKSRKVTGLPAWYDVFLAVASLVPTGYFSIFGIEQAYAALGYGYLQNVIFGWWLIILTVEASRRIVGNFFTGMIIVFLLWAKFSNLMPGVLYGPGYSWNRMGETMFLGQNGIFGIPIRMSATLIIGFMLFGQLIFACGAGKFLSDIAVICFGTMRGGSAKGAVVASGLFGMLSGSSVANVATTGAITFPHTGEVFYILDKNKVLDKILHRATSFLKGKPNVVKANYHLLFKLV